MTLDELALTPVPPVHAGAPDWLIGCFKRRAITFFTGETDVETSAFWLQSRGLSADIRIQPDRPDLNRRSSLHGCDPDELKALTASEGGLSETQWDGESMTWLGWTSFQLHSKWYDSGRLFRVGDCLIELGPNGAYVEDWRLQASEEGPLAGLKLIQERECKTGRITHQDGGLIVCGNHAAFVRGRPDSVTLRGRLSNIVGNGTGLSRTLIDEIFSCEASYGKRDSTQDSFRIVFSTNPLREGQDLISLDGFSYDPETRLVTQRACERGVLLERTFTVDTLEPSFCTRLDTPADRQVQDWLHQEAETLLTYAEFPNEDLSNNRVPTRSCYL
jgi:hypothetical protein